ncbi:hypothetical protein OHA37_15885 [Streptomyces sp. NBC_00335]|uniref:hypothetical protein n=1 Tax=unclassified Streptomyces TaxID=2593676 RepID=UPI0022541492|nr:MULTISPECIES: hypothetical protein [unclassified Streptomyces]MCX5405363.1 hypothetical protein [Streptomyces sp. NBC_00086]
MTDSGRDADGGIQYGDRVTINGGQGVIGIVKNQSPTIVGPQAAPVTPQEALRQLERLLLELRPQVTPAGAGTIDTNLPVIVSPESGPEARHGALMAVLGIATLAGEIGLPIIEAVGRVLELLGLA